jgi:hypothetical protein
MHRDVSTILGPAPSLALLGLSVAVGGLLACLQNVSTGTGTTDPTATASTATTSSGSVPSGAGCTTDPVSQITLCEESSLCPTIDVDQSILPGCGFRMRNSDVIDLECGCSDSLCPIGVADTCDEALTLLGQQTELSVCQQASEGRCVPLTSDAGASTSTGTSTTTTTTPAASSSCDKTCESECAGEPDCIQLCGC